MASSSFNRKYPTELLQPSESLKRRMETNSHLTQFEKPMPNSNIQKITVKKRNIDVPEGPISKNVKRKLFQDDQSEGSSQSEIQVPDKKPDQVPDKKPERPFWKNENFFQGKFCHQIDDGVKIRHNFDDQRNVHYIYLMKDNTYSKGLSPTYMEFSFLEATEISEIFKSILKEIEETGPCSLIPTLKNSSVKDLQDAKNEQYWSSEVCQLTSTNRTLIRPALVGSGTYLIRMLNKIPKTANNPHNWLGPSCSLQVPACHQLLAIFKKIMDSCGNAESNQGDTEEGEVIDEDVYDETDNVDG